MKTSLSVKFRIWIVGGLIFFVLLPILVGHSVCSNLEDKIRFLEFVCGTKITFTDLTVAFLSYCGVIFGWFTIRTTHEIVERAYLWPGYGLMIEDRHGARVGVHLGIRNTGRTVGLMKTVHHALIDKEDDKDPKKIITYEVYRDREDPIIPDPNTETRSGVWHRLNVMPKISRGWITYRDIFGETHRQEFRYLVHKSGRTDPLPNSFEYKPWSMKYKEIPSKQEPLPPDFKTVQIKNSETP